jgi:hypothetical protein
LLSLPLFSHWYRHSRVLLGQFLLLKISFNNTDWLGWVFEVIQRALARQRILVVVRRISSSYELYQLTLLRWIRLLRRRICACYFVVLGTQLSYFQC